MDCTDETFRAFFIPTRYQAKIQQKISACSVMNADDKNIFIEKMELYHSYYN